MGKFFFGVVMGVVLLLVGLYLFVTQGGMPMSVRAKPLPMERFLAHKALHAAMGSAISEQSPLAADETNLLAGAEVYRTNGCINCHGSFDSPEKKGGSHFFPPPPHLLPPSEGVTDDPVGMSYWVVKNGIRWSAMPAFGDRLSDTQIWQVSQLLHNAGKLPPSVQNALREQATK